MAKTITITVEEGAKISVDMNGYEGESCAAELQKLIDNLEALGVKVESKKVKAKSGAATNCSSQCVSH